MAPVHSDRPYVQFSLGWALPDSKFCVDTSGATKLASALCRVVTAVGRTSKLSPGPRPPPPPSGLLAELPQALRYLSRLRCRRKL